MKKILSILCMCFCLNSFSQIQYSQNDFKSFPKIKELSGPRIGVTYITPGRLSRDLEDEFGITSQFISQFGYQFERQVMGNEQVAGLVEGIIFIGGLEYGLFLPSISGLFGARFSSGYEFALGPNLSLSGGSLVFAVGRTLDLGNLYIPINIAWVPSVEKGDITHHLTPHDDNNEKYHTGNRFTLTVGFNFNK